jgi:hypothetical protein
MKITPFACAIILIATSGLAMAYFKHSGITAVAIISISIVLLSILVYWNKQPPKKEK